MAENPADEAATNRLGAPRSPKGAKPTFSQFGHWGWMNQQLSDAGWRYYSAVRSFIFDQDEEFEVDLTDEVIGELLGKSAKTVGRARRDCYAAGMIEELGYWKESVRVSGKAKPEVRTFRRLIVHHEVPEGYEGPVNAYSEKRRIERRRRAEQNEARQLREQQRAARPAAEAADDGAGDGAAEDAAPSAQGEAAPDEGSDRTDLSGQSDQGKHEPLDEGPAQCDRTDLSETGTDLSETGTDLSTSTGGDQPKQMPHLPSHLPYYQPTTGEPDTSHSDGWLEGSSTSSEQIHDTDSSGAGSNVESFDASTRTKLRRRRARSLITAIRGEYPDWHPPMPEAESRIAGAYAAGKTDPDIRAALLASFGGVRSVGAAITSRMRSLPGPGRQQQPQTSRTPRREGSQQQSSQRQKAEDAAFLDQLQA